MRNDQVHSQMGPRGKFELNSWKAYALFSIAGLIIILILAYGFYIGDRMTRVYAPLLNAAMEIKLEATSAHLWFEEIISGDHHENINVVWRHHDLAAWYAKAMLEGGQNPEGTFIALDDDDMRKKIKNVLSELEKFRKITEQRIASTRTSGIGTEIDQQYDSIFREFLVEADEVETRLQRLMAEALKRFRYTQVSLMIISILLFLIVGSIFWKYERSRTNHLQSLLDTKKSLKESEQRYRKLFNDAPTIYVITEEQNGLPIIKDVNNTFTKILGFSRDEAIGTSLAEYYTPESVHELFERGGYQRALSGEFIDSERSFVTRTGQIINTIVQAIPVRDKSGNHRIVRSTFLDITSRLRAEQEKEKLQAQLQQAQKMESIGNLAGGIAHDFNNILSSVIGFTELALDEIDKGSTTEDHMKEVYSAGKRARDLVRQILAFARQSDEEVQPIRVDRIAKEVLKFIRSLIPTSIEISANLECKSAIMGNATQLHQLFMNLCTNATQAMEINGGVLGVTLNSVSNANEDSGNDNDLSPLDYIEITVSDTGVGISPDIRDVIFEPYFTTKDPGEGTGMGLSLVHGIVKSYGGKITVDSTLGRGSKFTVLLPTISYQESQHTTVRKDELTGSEKILFVDDEAAIANMGSKILGHLGYSVTTCTSSMAALELFRAMPHKFDLIITDMTMPKLTGDRLATEMIKIREDIPIVLCTGYSRTMTRKTALDMGIKAFAHKPIIKADLARTVRDVLDEADGCALEA